MHRSIACLQCLRWPCLSAETNFQQRGNSTTLRIVKLAVGSQGLLVPSAPRLCTQVGLNFSIVVDLCVHLKGGQQLLTAESCRP